MYKKLKLNVIVFINFSRYLSAYDVKVYFVKDDLKEFINSYFFLFRFEKHKYQWKGIHFVV